MSDVKNSGLATGLVSYWELEEASGTRIDSHGSNDLTDNNTVTQGTGIQGNAADFSGSSESLTILNADQTGLAMSGSFSVNLWVNFDVTSSYAYPFIRRTEVFNSPQFNYFAFVRTNEMGFGFFDTTGSQRNTYVNSGINFTTGTWYMLTYVFDATANTLTQYKDTTQIGQVTGITQTPRTDGAQTFALGERVDASVNFINGRMDEVGVWSRALTAGERTDLYNSGAGIPYDAGGGGGFTKPNYLGFSRL